MKVLIADDMASWREYLKNAVIKILGQNNIQIDKASSGNEAYNLILENNNEPYNLIITDLQMESDHEPKHAGEWLVEQTKMLRNYYNTKIIMVSASTGVKIIAENLGVDSVTKAALSTDINCLEEILISAKIKTYLTKT